MAVKPNIVLSPAELELRSMLYDINPGAASRVEQFDQEQVLSDARNTRIIVHPRYPALVQAFLDHKRKHGSDVEKRLYGTSQQWPWQAQIIRLVRNRPLVFMNSADHTVLRDGTAAGALADEWDRVGTDAEARNEHVKLADYLSYDEMMLGSLLGVSGPSSFINVGDRYNRGRPDKPGSFEERGVVVGVVGARFERHDRMDSALMQPPPPTPRQHAALTQLFTDFFGARRDEDAAPLDRAMYRGRMRITVDVLLLEAEAQGRREARGARPAYVHVVGLGLGVWAIDPARQTADYVACFADALDDERVGAHLAHVGTLDFAYIPMSEALRARLDAAAARRGIAVRVSKRNPAARLAPPNDQDVLVVSYAWDGNALPGNEYWQGSLAASGDPAAACMSTISELHNPFINVRFLERIEVLDPLRERGGAIIGSSSVDFLDIVRDKR
jgi:hypothetical protein